MKPSALAVVTAACAFSSAVAFADEPRPGEGGRDHFASDRAARFGPAVSAGLPDGGRVDVRVRWQRLLTIGAAGAWVPQMSLPVSGVDASVTRVAVEGYARVHPFRGRFFLGVAGGWTRIKGTDGTTVRAFGQSTPVQANGYAGDTYVAPHLGVVWTFAHGITAGMDVGAQIPVVSSGPTFDAEKYGLVTAVDGKGALAQALRLSTTHVIHVFHLLELGVML